MTILKIDQTLYEVDLAIKTYHYYGRPPDWKNLSKEENTKNKKHINGYPRIFSDGRKKSSSLKSSLSGYFNKEKDRGKMQLKAAALRGGASFRCLRGQLCGSAKRNLDQPMVGMDTG